MTGSPLRRAPGAFLLGAGLLVALATGRMIRDGKERLEAGLAHADAGEAALAAAALEDAARCYAPGSPYPGRALERLSIMARAAEMRGESGTARHLWEVVRRSVLATRHVFQPNGEALRRAEGALARLDRAAVSERSEAPAAGRPGAPPRPEDPSPLASILLAAGLLAWIAGAAFALAAPGTGARARARRAAWITSLCGLASWLVMAWLA